MNPILKYIVLIFCITISPVPAKSSAEEGYTLEELKNAPEVLRRIATDIVSQKEHIEFIQRELQRKHGPEAFSLWSTYNQDDLPNVEVLKTLELSDVLTQGKSIDSKLRKNNLRPLVGKTKITVFSEEFIENVQGFLMQFVTKGQISLTDNKMQVGDVKDHLLVECAFPSPLARVYQKEKVSPPVVQEIEAGSEIISIMFGGDHIEALMRDRNALDGNSFPGKIISIYQSEK